MDFTNNNENLLFKYTPINMNLIRLLVNAELWFPSFNKLNDPHEGQFEIEKTPLPSDDFLLGFYQTRKWKRFTESAAESHIRKIKKDERLFYRDIKRDIYENYFKYIKVISFSTVMDEVLLWSHYGDEHRGVCLIFDKSVLKASDGLNWQGTDDAVEGYDDDAVEYDNRRNLKIAFPHAFGDRIVVENLGEVIFRKLRNWDYEKEYRFYTMCSFHSSATKAGIANRFKRGALVGIIFGERCPLADIRLIFSVLKSNGFVNPGFTLAAAKLVPFMGKLTAIQDATIEDVEDFILKRNDWLYKTEF